MKRSLQKGFTLIELLVVIAIIAILSAIVITSLAPAQRKAKVAAFQAEARSAAAGFVIMCDDGEFDSSTLNYPADSGNIEWVSNSSITIDSADCADQLGAFTISNIPAKSVDCSAEIINGNVTFSGADCS